MLQVRYLLFIALLVFSTQALAIPTFLTHQGKVSQSNGSPVVGSANTTFTLYGQETEGSAIWTQTMAVTFDAGYFSVVLGPGSPELSTDVFDGSDLYLGITLEGTDEFAPRHQITSVPYAFRAGSVTGEVNAVDGLTVDGQELVDSSGNVNVTGTLSGEVNAINGLVVDGVIIVDTSGNLIVPGAAEVVSGLKLGDDDSECTSDNGGTMRWHADALEVCDGTAWVSTTGTATEVQLGEDPDECTTEKNGTMRWQNGNLELCDGSTWRHIQMTLSNTDGVLAPDGAFNINADGHGDYPDGVAYEVAANPTDATITCGATVNGFESGDKALLINMQGVIDDNGDVGNFEILDVVGVSGDTLTFSQAPSKSYDGNDFNDQKVIVQRFPQYSRVELDSNDVLTAGAWDDLQDHSGSVFTGIVAFQVSGDVTIGDSASIDVDELGFRGGIVGAQGAADARRTNIVTGGTNGANGGTGNQHAGANGGSGPSGTGQGGNGGTVDCGSIAGGVGSHGGGSGASRYQGWGGGGAGTYSSGENYSDQTHLTLGGGAAQGGGGGAGMGGEGGYVNGSGGRYSNAQEGGNGSVGGKGGGLVIIISNGDISGNGTISAKGGTGGSGGGGASGNASRNTHKSGGGGGGGGANGAAGGTVYVQHIGSFSVTVDVSGGTGGGAGGGAGVPNQHNPSASSGGGAGAGTGGGGGAGTTDTNVGCKGGNAGEAGCSSTGGAANGGGGGTTGPGGSGGGANTGGRPSGSSSCGWDNQGRSSSGANGGAGGSACYSNCGTDGNYAAGGGGGGAGGAGTDGVEIVFSP